MIPDRIAILNSDGTTDTSFAVGAGLDNTGYAVTVLPSGEVVAAGDFGFISGAVRPKLAIIEADGTLVSGVPTPSAVVNTLALQTEGSIIFGGSFTSVSGTTRNRLARLLPDFTLDPAFNPDANGSVLALALQEDGKILAGGSFTSVGSTTRNRVARLYNGTASDSLYVVSSSIIKWDRTGTNEETQRVKFELDTGSGYNPLAGLITRTSSGWQIDLPSALSGSTNDVRATAFPSDSHSCGTHQTVASFPVLPEISVTINNVPMTDGVSTFPFSSLQVGATSTATVTITNLGLGVLSLTSDVTISGQWEIVSQPTTSIPSLESVSFNIRFAPTSEGAKSGTLSIFSDDSDEGTFTVALTGTATAGPGGLDLTWQPNANGAVRALAKSGDDYVWLGGDFTTVKAASRPRLARIDEDAVLQAQAATVIPAGTINCIAQLPDGTALVGGQFSTKKLYWVGLDSSGSVTLKSTSFDLASAYTGHIPSVKSLSVQADGSVIVGGDFLYLQLGPNTTKLTNRSNKLLARINFPYGVASVDNSFRPSLPGSNVLGTTIQADGKILVCGSLRSADSSLPIPDTVRLNPDGSRDITFAPDTRYISAIAVDTYGKVIVSGSNAYIDSSPKYGVSRLSPLGVLDTTFTLAPSAALTLLPMTDSSLIVSSEASGPLASTSRLERFLSDGSADTTFVAAITGTVRTVCSQEDGALLIGGSFGTTAGSLTSARIINNSASSSLTVVDPTEVQWLRSGAIPETQVVVFDLSQDDGASWVRLGQGQRITGGWHLPSISLPYSGLLRARAYIQSAGNSSIMEDQISFSGLNVPDLIVQVPGTAIVADNGQASPVSSVAGNILSVPVTLVNTGLASLTGVVATVTTAPVAGTGKWSLNAAPNGTIVAGGTSTLVVNFSPSFLDKGLLYANLSITSSVAGLKNPYTVLLVGAAVVPPLATTNPVTLSSGGIATFNGSFVPNDLTATAYFRYRLTSSSTWVNTTPTTLSGFTTPQGYASTISGLTVGVSYTVQAVITNSSNATSPTYGASVAFTPIA